MKKIVRTNLIVCPVWIMMLTMFFCYSQKNVNADVFEQMLKEDKMGVCIDLRTPDEIKKYGKIPGAMEVDWLSKDSEKKLLSLDRKKHYYVYCAGGGRSAEAMDWMLRQGFTNVVNLEKGFSDWKKSGKKIDEKKHYSPK